MPDEVFGPLVTGADVGRWALDTLKLWTPEYLAYAERAKGLPARSLPAPKTWVATSGLDKWPEDRLPCVLVLSPGLVDPPSRDGRGRYTADFGLGVAVVVSDRTEEDAQNLAQLYVAALRLLLVQKGRLGGHALATDWIDERFDSMPPDRGARRQLACGQAVFRVSVEAVVAKSPTGPTEARPDPYVPYPDRPRVASAEVELAPREV